MMKINEKMDKQRVKSMKVNPAAVLRFESEPLFVAHTDDEIRTAVEHLNDAQCRTMLYAVMERLRGVRWKYLSEEQYKKEHDARWPQSYEWYADNPRLEAEDLADIEIE